MENSSLQCTHRRRISCRMDASRRISEYRSSGRPGETWAKSAILIRRQSYGGWRINFDFVKKFCTFESSVMCGCQSTSAPNQFVLSSEGHYEQGHATISRAACAFCISIRSKCLSRPKSCPSASEQIRPSSGAPCGVSSSPVTFDGCDAREYSQ